ncbi:MAG: type II toxin-antitoxin system RelE family toxin [Pseudonocardiaceae bacterium]
MPLGLNPRRPGTRALTGYPPGTMRLRIGDYRSMPAPEQHTDDPLRLCVYATVALLA